MKDLQTFAESSVWPWVTCPRLRLRHHLSLLQSLTCLILMARTESGNCSSSSDQSLGIAHLCGTGRVQNSHNVSHRSTGSNHCWGPTASHIVSYTCRNSTSSSLCSLDPTCIETCQESHMAGNPHLEDTIRVFSQGRVYQILLQHYPRGPQEGLPQ